MTLIDAIKTRKSVRTYDGRPLSPEHIAHLEKAIADASEFSAESFITVTYTADGTFSRVPSTYGFIKGVRTFILIAIKSANKAEGCLAAGYACEAAVIRATELGIGTCWLAGTWSKKDFSKVSEIPPGYELSAVITAGYPLERPRLFEKMIRKAIGCNNRRPFNELFFEETWGKPVTAHSPLEAPLEAVRLAPSSTNSQPWRVVIADDKAHFYYKPTTYVMFDMGIALFHFCRVARLRCRLIDDPLHPQAPAPYKYLGSVVVNF